MHLIVSNQVHFVLQGGDPVSKQNIIPNSERTPEERSEIARKGGIASGKARGFRAAIKKRFKEHPELIDNIIDGLLEMVLQEHDLNALSYIIELNGESARQMEIALKKQELKLKKEIAENEKW